MMPTIWPGDILTVRRCSLADLKLEQIALYQRGNALVAHRVTDIRSGYLTTRGDSSLLDDSPVRESEIVGLVVSIDRRGRSVNPGLSFWVRAGSFILRHSDFALRLAVRLARRSQHPKKEEISWSWK
jgi:hypothetical protein